MFGYLKIKQLLMYVFVILEWNLSFLVIKASLFFDSSVFCM